MRFKKVSMTSGRKLFGAFAASLFIVIVIGLIGIFQIQFLSKKVDILGRYYLPMQVAVQELKASNNLYVTEIKNYALWKGSGYLEAARAAPDLKAADAAVNNFQNQLQAYSLHLKQLKKEAVIDLKWADQQKQKIEDISLRGKELRSAGARIIELVKDKADFETINVHLMEFDSALYRVNDFIAETIAKDIVGSVQEQISVAEQAKNQAVTFLWWSLALGVFIGSQTAWLVSKNLKHEFQRRQSVVREMIRTEERERKHLSAQVHDQMSQDLGALKIYLGLIQQEIRNLSSDLGSKVKQSKKIVTGLLNKAHNISLLLRPPSLDELGLLDSLEALISDYKRLKRVKIDFRKPKQEPKLSPEYRLYFYRFTQEVLTNAAKYAAAKNIEIELKVFEKEAELSYQDNGKGFDYAKLLQQSGRRREDKVKLGLLSLQERAELLGGTMQIDTAPGKGTKIKVKLKIQG